MERLLKPGVVVGDAVGMMLAVRRVVILGYMDGNGISFRLVVALKSVSIPYACLGVPGVFQLRVLFRLFLNLFRVLLRISHPRRLPTRHHPR